MCGSSSRGPAYLAGPREDGLAEAVEKKFLGRMGDNVSDRMKHEVKQLSKVAAKRGKKKIRER